MVWMRGLTRPYKHACQIRCNEEGVLGRLSRSMCVPFFLLLQATGTLEVMVIQLHFHLHHLQRKEVMDIQHHYKI